MCVSFAERKDDKRYTTKIKFLLNKQKYRENLDVEQNRQKRKKARKFRMKENFNWK